MTRLRWGDVVAFSLLLIAATVAVFFGGIDPLSSGLTGLSIAAVVQSSYSSTMEPAVAGMWANMTNWDADTRICETAAGIGFGLACGQGTGDKGAVIAGSLAIFVGVSVKDVTLVHDTADEYQEHDNMAVATEGDIWVQTSVSTSPTADVHYSATTGIFATSGGSGPIVGARWMATRDAGLGLLRLSGHLPVA